MKPGAPLVHPDLLSYPLGTWVPAPGDELIREGNVCAHVSLRYGDVEQGFRQSEVVVAETFHTSRVFQCYTEPHAALASFDSSGNLTLWATVQGGFFCRLHLAHLLQIPESRIRVLSPHIGGAFGGKTECLAAPACVFLAQKARRPVKLTLTREEDFLAARPRHPGIMEMKAGARKDGTILARIERLNPKINAFTTLVGDRARDAARAVEGEILAGRYRGPFHGIPVGIKDLTDTAGIRTTYGSDSFRDYVPTEDAEIVRRLKEAGAIILGKTATHEIGMGITTNNPYFGPTRNPWNLERIPGGSSGGSAAAIAAGMAILCSGNDGGSSIRIRACFCGVVGVKPTLGLISRFGLITGAPPSTFVVEGPLGKTVTDCALALHLWAGVDPRDPFTHPVPIPDYVAAIEAGTQGMRVGISPDLFLTPVDPEVRASYERALKILQAAGATVHEVRLPATQRAAENFSQAVDGDLAVPLPYMRKETIRNRNLANPALGSDKTIDKRPQE